MDTLVLTIFIATVLIILVFVKIKLFNDSSSIKKSKLSYNERIFLQANLDVELNNDNLTDRQIRAGGREKKKDFKGAIEDINVILEHDTNNAGLIFKRGLNKFLASDFKGAIIDFSEVLKTDPTDKYSFYYKGIAHLKLSNFRNAINDFTSALTMGIGEKELFYHRGLAEIEVDRYNEAIDDFNIYLAEHPNALEAFFNRGVAYNKSGYPEYAIKDFNKVIDLNPNHEKAFFERAFAKKNLEDLVGYSNDLKTSYNKGYLHAYHYLKET